MKELELKAKEVAEHGANDIAMGNEEYPASRICFNCAMDGGDTPRLHIWNRFPAWSRIIHRRFAIYRVMRIVNQLMIGHSLPAAIGDLGNSWILGNVDATDGAGDD